MADWIFEGNPRNYDLEAAVASSREQWWGTPHFRDAPDGSAGGYAPYLSWWRSQLISGPSLRPAGCSQSSCRPRAVRSSHW
jgi:hypothetical protein